MNASCVGFSFGAAILMWLAAIVTAQGSIDLKQGWKAADKERFWFTPQGSLLLPYDWFKYLEQPSSNELFRSDANISKFGYIPATPSGLINPDGFPIGFAKDSDRSGQSFVGMTCAACHTAKLTIAATDVIVEGAPALADFRAFVTGLVDALDATSSSATKFTAFAEKVLGHTPSQGEAEDLKKKLNARREDLRLRWLYQGLPTEYGPARLDAFGGLYNQVVAYELGVPANAKPPDAPVSYPFLWDTPHHDKVQWNGSAPNGLAGYGPIFRNIGEALGVFGTLEFKNSGNNPPKYVSSVNVDNQKALEDLLCDLRSPVWPEAALPTKPALVRQGAIVYGMYCSGCHAILKDPGDRNRKVKAKMVDAISVGTDPRFVVNFAERFGDATGSQTGILKGAYKTFPVVSSRFKDLGSGGDIFSNAILGTYLGRNLGAIKATAKTGEAADPGLPDAIRELVKAIEGAKSQAAYKARPLNGIWATAPYLHNGSVPTIAELLKEPSNRAKTFWIGSHELDPDTLGLAYGTTGFRFDTGKPGNSNQGHAYGTTLADDHKRALIEFLKKL